VKNNLAFIKIHDIRGDNIMSKMKHCTVEFVGVQPGLAPGSEFKLYDLVEPAEHPFQGASLTMEMLADEFEQVTVLPNDEGDTQ
jgi:hypothetical protein